MLVFWKPFAPKNIRAENSCSKCKSSDKLRARMKCCNLILFYVQSRCLFLWVSFLAGDFHVEHTLLLRIRCPSVHCAVSRRLITIYTILCLNK